MSKNRSRISFSQNVEKISMTTPAWMHDDEQTCCRGYHIETVEITVSIFFKMIGVDGDRINLVNSFLKITCKECRNHF